MREYSQGICEDGAAILCDGVPMDIELILSKLRALEMVTIIVGNSSIEDGHHPIDKAWYVLERQADYEPDDSHK